PGADVVQSAACRGGRGGLGQRSPHDAAVRRDGGGPVEGDGCHGRGERSARGEEPDKDGHPQGHPMNGAGVLGGANDGVHGAPLSLTRYTRPTTRWLTGTERR